MTAEIIILPGRAQEIARECDTLMGLLAFVRTVRKTLADEAEALCGPDVSRAEALARLRCFREAIAELELDYENLRRRVAP